MSDYPPPPPGVYPPPPPPPPEGPAPPRGGISTRAKVILGTVAAVIVLIGIVVAVGGGDDDNTATDRPEATVTPPGADADVDTTIRETTTTEAADGIPDAARTYFEAFATVDLSRMGGMLDSSVEGSPAALYATHQIAVLRALGATGSIESTFQPAGDSIVVRSVSYDLQGNEVEETTTYGGFTVDGGKLTGFTVDDVPVEDRIRAGEAVSSGGVTVRVVTAYQTGRGDLALNVDVTNGGQGVLEVSDSEWSLVTADGRQVAPSQQWFNVASGSVQPGATAGRAVLFEQVGLGGTLRFVAFADDFVTEVRFDVPVPA